MPLPNSKQELADWILRRLGAPVVNVEIADVQLEDVIDEAVQFFQEYHYDGAERCYRTLKITDDVITGNDRIHQNINAPMYDVTLDKQYRLGDRVMTYKQNGMPDKIWVRFDSDETVTYRNFVQDNNGDWFVKDSDIVLIDYKYLFDSEARDNEDSDGVYVLYDSDSHNYLLYYPVPDGQSSVGSFVDSDGSYVLYDSDKHFSWVADSEGEYAADSDNNYVLFDSDIHTLKYVVDSDNGNRVRLYPDSEVYIQYDSENHSTLQRYRVENFAREAYESDASGALGYWVYDVNNNTYVPFDSEMYSTVSYESDAYGGYVDSDGVMTVYNPTKYTVYTYDSDYIRTDSDGTAYRTIDSEGDLAGLYVLFKTDSEDYYELYDSDKHISIFKDSDGLGQQVTFDATNGRIFKRTISYAPVQRFRRVTLTTLVQRYNLVYYPYVRYNKVQTSDKFFRRTEPLGQRYTLSYSRDVRVVGSSFNDYWKEENDVITEQVIDYDYSKQGQVGIPVPDTIIGISKVFRIDNFSGMGMWNYEYQYFLNNFDFFYGNGGASSMGMTNYYITKSYMDLIDHMMNVQPAIRFNKHRNRLYIDSSWTRLGNMAKSKDYYLMIECYEVNDPEVFGDVYQDKWLKRYATALAKQQWGSNMKKYSNTELPGGLMIDGQAMYDEATAEKDALEEELKTSQLEMDFIIG